MNPVAVYTCAGAFLACAILVGIERFTRKPATSVQSVAKGESNESRLKIISAMYGIGDCNDRDVTDVLRKYLRGDGLMIRINNHTLLEGSDDPAPWKDKFLKVQYSFASLTKPMCIRKEDTDLYLPVDVDHIERTAAEYAIEQDKLRVERDAQLDKNSELHAEVSRLNSHIAFMQSETPEYVKKNHQLTIDLARCKASLGDSEERADRLENERRRPSIVPVSFGQAGFPVERSGAFGMLLSNDGPSVALNVTIPAFRVGRWSVMFSEVQRIDTGQKLATEVFISDGNEGARNLIEILRRHQSESGNIGDPIEFAINYRDIERKYSANCDLRLDGTCHNGLRITIHKIVSTASASAAL